MLQYCTKQIKANINKYILHVLSIKLRYKLYFSFSIPTPGFPHFLLYVRCKSGVTFIRRSFRDVKPALLFTTFHNKLTFSYLIFYEMLIANNITKKVQGVLCIMDSRGRMPNNAREMEFDVLSGSP